MNSKVQYKSPGIKTEFQDEKRVDSRLQFGVLHLAHKVWRLNMNPLLLTDVLRDNRLSQHFADPVAEILCTATDIRAHHGYYNSAELRILRLWYDETYPRRDILYKVGTQTLHKLMGFYAHGEGDVFHIHLSVDIKAIEPTLIVKEKDRLLFFPLKKYLT